MPQFARQPIAADALPAVGLPQGGNGGGALSQTMLPQMLVDPAASTAHPPEPVTERVIAALSRWSGLVALALAYGAVAHLLLR